MYFQEFKIIWEKNKGRKKGGGRKEKAGGGGGNAGGGGGSTMKREYPAILPKQWHPNCMWLLYIGEEVLAEEAVSVQSWRSYPR